MTAKIQMYLNGENINENYYFDWCYYIIDFCDTSATTACNAGSKLSRGQSSSAKYQLWLQNHHSRYITYGGFVESLGTSVRIQIKIDISDN